MCSGVIQGSFFSPFSREVSPFSELLLKSIFLKSGLIFLDLNNSQFLLKFQKYLLEIAAYMNEFINPGNSKFFHDSRWISCNNDRGFRTSCFYGYANNGYDVFIFFI